MPWPMVGAAIAGGLGLVGGQLANKSRRREAQKDRMFQSKEAGTTRDWQSGQAGRQMRFQERMRNTEWQSAVADMREAGVNPALAYSRGGASSPGGSSGSGATASGSRANQEDPITPAISSALQYKRLSAEIEAIKAGVLKTRAETDAVKGRPGRILEPAVSAGARSMTDLFSERTLGILNYEAGSSAKQILQATQRTIENLKQSLARLRSGFIGPNRTRRR